MNQLRLLLWSWIDTIRSLARGGLWAPFLTYLLFQGAVILILTQFHQPILRGLVIPFVQFLGESPLFGKAIADYRDMLHYPVFFLALPGLFARLLLLLDLLVGVWLMGIAFLRFWEADRPAEPSTGTVAPATRAWIRLIAAHLPATLLILLFVYGLPRWIFGEVGEIGGNLLRLRRVWPVVVGSVIEAAFLYLSLAILVERRTILGAVARSVGMAKHLPLATLGAVLLPNFIQVPMAMLLARSDRIVVSLSPEVVAWLLFFCVALYTVATFFIVAVGARLFRVQVEGTGV